VLDIRAEGVLWMRVLLGLLSVDEGLEVHHEDVIQKQNRRFQSTFQSKNPAISFANVEYSLCLNDARRDEENQLLVGGADAAAFEQVSHHRNVTQ
jgi:hypothetical protein